MTKPQLILTSTDGHIRVMDSYYNSFDADDLWEKANDSSTYLFVRTPMMIELARREDSRILDLCESLLKSGEIEEWFVALRVLASMKNDVSCSWLIDLYKESEPHRRSYIAKYTAMVVGPKNVSEFKKIALSISAAGTINVSGWTKTALKCLKSSCKRLGIVIVKSEKLQKQIETSEVVVEDGPALFTSHRA